MQAQETTITVGGIDVHAWVGGQGPPLLVLHGAGGNRGWTRWLGKVVSYDAELGWIPRAP